MSIAQNLISRLEHCKQTGEGKWMAKCPSHQDKSPSLSIKEAKDGRLLINCFGGCGAVDVVQAVGLELSDLFPPDDNYKGFFRGSKAEQKELDRLHLEICKAARARGERLTAAEKQAELEAFMRVRSA